MTMPAFPWQTRLIIRAVLCSHSPSQELGSFMKNKLIMHTKLHLQETFRCILQSSKMIRFTFCSRRLVTPVFQARLELQVCQCSPCTAGHPMGSQPLGSRCQVHRLGPQPGEPWPSDLTGASKGKPGSFCGQGAISAVCKRTPMAPCGEPGVQSKGYLTLGEKSHLQSDLGVCLFCFAKPQRREIQQHWSFPPSCLLRGVRTPSMLLCSGRRGGIYQGSEPVQPHTWQIICGIVVFIVT